MSNKSKAVWYWDEIDNCYVLLVENEDRREFIRLAELLHAYPDAKKLDTKKIF